MKISRFRNYNFRIAQPRCSENQHIYEKKMCNLIKWYCDENGYVFQCVDCRHFQVCFGTTMLTLSDEEFRYFTEVVADRTEHLPDTMEMPCKCIVLPTPSANIQCILNRTELLQLHQMLQDCEVEIRTSQMMQLFKG